MKPGQDPWTSTGSPPDDWPVTPPPDTPATGRAGQDQDPQARAGAPGIGGQEQGNPGQPGTCYLLHFSEPCKHARHYSGNPADLAARLAEHEAARGSRLLQVAKAAGITWTLARTWPGGRPARTAAENQGGASRRCPECGVKPRSNPGERKEATGMKQPPEKDTGRAPGMKTPSEHGPTTWARAELQDQIQRIMLGLEAGQHAREADGPPPTDRRAEPARTAPGHAGEPPTGQQLTGTAGRAEAAARRADEHTRAARSVECECQARAGAPCGPAGDHLARYLRAEQAGALTRDSLTQVIAGLDVIAPRAFIQPPGERAAPIGAAKAAGAQASAGMNADRAGGAAHSPLAPQQEALGRSHGRVSAIGARGEREMEAGS